MPPPLPSDRWRPNTIDGNTRIAEVPLRLSITYDRPIAEPGFSIGAETSDKRRVTVQVRNRLGDPWPGRWIVRFMVLTGAHGAPAGTQTVTVATGALLQAITADRDLEVLTDSGGVCAIDVEVSGAGTRHVRALVIGEGEESGEITWA